jgi:hypothetical protein
MKHMWRKSIHLLFKTKVLRNRMSTWNRKVIGLHWSEGGVGRVGQDTVGLDEWRDGSLE